MPLSQVSFRESDASRPQFQVVSSLRREGAQVLKVGSALQLHTHECQIIRPFREDEQQTSSKVGTDNSNFKFSLETLCPSASGPDHLQCCGFGVHETPRRLSTAAAALGSLYCPSDASLRQHLGSVQVGMEQCSNGSLFFRINGAATKAAYFTIVAAA